MKKKILIIDNSMYKTGAFNSILNSSLFLRKNFDFIFIIPKNSTTAKYLDAEKFKFYELPFLEISKSYKIIFYFPMLLINSYHLNVIAKKEMANIIHVNDFYNLIGHTCKIFNSTLKSVYHVRLLKTSYIKKIYPLLVLLLKKFSNHTIVVSKSVLQDLGFTKTVQIIYDTITSKEFYQDWDGLQDEHLKILFLGNYTPGKGQIKALKSFIEFNRNYSKSSLKFVGDCSSHKLHEFKYSLVRLAEKSNLLNNVQFLEKTDNVEKIMKCCDVVLNLSESESFSLVCLEALFYGIPLITSDSGGPRELTENGRRAILLKENTISHTVTALESIVRNKAFYKRLAAESKEWARKEFESTHSYSQLHQIYNSIS